MILFPAALQAEAPALRLTAASVGRREYAVELRFAGEMESSAESARIAERFALAGGTFRRTRYVVGSASDDETPEFKPGAKDAATLGPDNAEPKPADRARRIPLPDVSFPPGPLAPGREWTSPFPLIGGTVRCRYVGEETVAARPAARIALLFATQDGEAIPLDGSTLLLDRGDALPLAMLLVARTDVLGGRLDLRFRLRRTNVPGLGFPDAPSLRR